MTARTSITHNPIAIAALAAALLCSTSAFAAPASPLLPDFGNLQAAEEEQPDAAAIQEYLTQLRKDPNTPWVGARTPKKVGYLFVDASYVDEQGIAESVAKAVAKDPTLRIYHVHFPDAGQEYIAAGAIAASHQGKYKEFVSWALEAEDVSPGAVLAAADDLGLDLRRFAKDLNDEAIANSFQQNWDLASALGIDQAFAFYIDGKVLMGEDATTAAIQSAVAASRPVGPVA